MIIPHVKIERTRRPDVRVRLLDEALASGEWSERLDQLASGEPVVVTGCELTEDERPADVEPDDYVRGDPDAALTLVLRVCEDYYINAWLDS